MTDTTPPGKYQVGLLESFGSDDPYFNFEQEAIKYATARSAVNNPLDIVEVAWGVWDVESGECIAIAYCGDLYTK